MAKNHNNANEMDKTDANRTEFANDMDMNANKTSEKKNNNCK